MIFAVIILSFFTIFLIAIVFDMWRHINELKHEIEVAEDLDKRRVNSIKHLEERCYELELEL